MVNNGSGLEPYKPMAMKPLLVPQSHHFYKVQGRIQDFKLGGGGALKKLRSAEGGREKCWGISCEKSRFYAKKLYVFQLRREARKFLGYFV
jgi:hypothetical protein